MANEDYLDCNLFGESKLKNSIRLLRDLEPPEGYYLAFSGGKDSIVLKAVADIAGVKYDAHYSVTTIDPPEVIRFMKARHKDVKFDVPPKSFFELSIHNGLPTRLARWCCRELKERGGSGRCVLTGIRRAESFNRKKRRQVEFCMTDTTKRFVHPLIEWTDNDIWSFIRENKLPYCELYNQGLKRVGCLFCPFKSTKQRQFEVKKYPNQAKAIKKSIGRWLIETPHKDKEMKCGKTPDEIFDWWISGKSSKKEVTFGLFGE